MKSFALNNYKNNVSFFSRILRKILLIIKLIEYFKKNNISLELKNNKKTINKTIQNRNLFQINIQIFLFL
jgi:hypothetical protein